MAETVSFYIQEAVAEELRVRGDNRSQIINRDLERLYGLYKNALRDIELSVQEAWLLVDALNGVLIDACTVRFLWANIEDACVIDGLDKKWRVDREAIVEKVKDLTDIQAMALVDAAERFWAASADKKDEEFLRKCFRIAD